MVIKNHIAYRFLTDDRIWFEIVETTHKVDWQELMEQENNSLIDKIPDKIHSLYSLLHSEGQKPYVITDSVINNLEHLKVKKTGNHYDWTYFKNIKDQKVTFILPDNVCMRVLFQEDMIHFFNLKYEHVDKKSGTGHMKWIMYYLNRNTGELCEHFEHDDVKQIEESVYKLLSFFYLADIQEEYVAPGMVYGTKKTGKVLNDFKFPLTIVSSKWNITSIRTERFNVCGHFAHRWTGEGRTIPKVVFIEPFEKEGYVRKAKKLNE